MSWTYRVARIQAENGEEVFGIVEAYNDGDIKKPHSITVEFCAPQGETPAELATDLRRMLKALDLPTLEHGEFETVIR